MAKAKTSHTGFRNGKMFCFNCGGSHDLVMPLPLKEMTDAMDGFQKLHKNCKPGWKPPEPDISQSERQRADWWLANGERGMSSEAIFSTITGQSLKGYTCHPSDPDDFRRCYLLLKAVPEWRSKMDKMRNVSEVWNKLVDNWDKLTEMLEAAMQSKDGKAPGMYELMKSLGC